ncbi:MAG: sulfatase activating formylglycine-generating enzyme, partial [Hyphomicrobiaceae bacterium]
REGRLEPKRVAKILLQILEALNTAHNISEHESILHLDLKPKNIFYLDKPTPESPDRIKVIDFGIGQYIGANKNVDAPPTEAKAADQPSDSAEVSDLATSQRSRDDGGTLQSIIHRSTACTPEYASPEQCTHMLPESKLEELGTKFTRLDARSDLYSLGVMGFQLLTGQLPFERPAQRKDFFELHIAGPPRKTGKQGIKIPRKLAKFIDQCLVKDPDQRWKTTEDACQALRHIVNPPIWKPIALVGVPLLIATGVIAGLGNKDAANQFYAPAGAIYAGADTPRTKVDTRGLPSDQYRRETIVVTDTADLSTALPWKAAWEGDSLFLEAQDGAPLEAHAFLVVDYNASNPFRTDKGFPLIYLDSDAVALNDASVPELGGRAVDPNQQKLDILVRGRSADISSVTVQFGSSDARPAQALGNSESSSSVAKWSIDLDKFGLADGANELTVEVTDKAGAKESLNVPLLVALGSLDATHVELAGVTPWNNKLRILPSSQPRLKLKLNRKANVSWSLRRASADTDEPMGRREQVSSLDVELNLIRDSAYEGSILISLSEDAYVFHSLDSRNSSSRELDPIPFEFTDESPDFLAIYAIGTESIQTLEIGGAITPIFLNRTTARLDISLKQTSPVYFEVARADSNEIEYEHALTDTAQTSFRATLDLKRADIHDYEIRGFPCDTQTKEKLGEAEIIKVRFIVDDVAPKFQLEGPADVVLKDPEWIVPALRVGVTDASDLEIPTPVNFTWEIRANGTLIDSDSWDDQVSPVLSVPMQVALKPSVRRSAPDGEYELRVIGADAAGNTVDRANYSFDVATEGPVLTLESPNNLNDWNYDSELGINRFSFLVEAEDYNGIGSLQCTLVDSVNPELSETTELRLKGKSGSSESWVGEFDLRSEWSEREVELHLSGVDAHGMDAIPITETRNLAVIEDFIPDSISLTLASNPSASLSPMHKVTGNRVVEYIALGRADSTENDLFGTTFKTMRYNSMQSSASWEIKYKPGAIADFYMDETEVSVEQFLQFVTDPDGFQNAAHWVDGGQPDTARHTQLISLLESQSKDLPVTKVKWDEASAYAHWCGKRLPSLIEWEYAVRGGTLYRPYSAYSYEVNLDPDPKRFRYNDYDGAPWPIEAGDDLTPDTGLRNLCTNVSEWCWTPQLFTGVEGTRAKLHAQNHPAWVLDPSQNPKGIKTSARFWTLGGDFKNPQLDFSEISARPRDVLDRTIGFRCALSARDVLRTMESSSPGALLIETISK